MNKTFNINLGGYPFAINDDAYSYVQKYLDSIQNHFSDSKGCDDIVNDIEVRMAELFNEHLRGRIIISMREVNEVIAIMGKPEDFGAEPLEMQDNFSHTTNETKTSLGTAKKLFRNPEDKKIAGVCSGIAAYFGIDDPIWIRLLFILMFFTVGSGALAYIIMWALVPEAKTSSDKLAMRGEPTTVSNIAKLVEDEITEFGDKINKWSKDFTSKKG